MNVHLPFRHQKPPSLANNVTFLPNCAQGNVTWWTISKSSRDAITRRSAPSVPHLPSLQLRRLAHQSSHPRHVDLSRNGHKLYHDASLLCLSRADGSPSSSPARTCTLKIFTFYALCGARGYNNADAAYETDRRTNPSRYWRLLRNLSGKQVSAPPNQPINF